VETERVAVAGGNKIAGVVLAGGRSSRMGKNKAFLEYKGMPLLDYMIRILEAAGLQDIYVSGDIEGYRCIPDSRPYNGPAHAICDVMKSLQEYDGALFVPIDMPFLTPDMLCVLLDQKHGAYFQDHALPAFIRQPCNNKSASSVRWLLQELDIPAFPLPEEFRPCMGNFNTPEEWREALRA
jgi:molybdopterin-guanine dinucleotide biosynthesis protein A